MGCDRRETGRRRKIVRRPVECQGREPEQGDTRAEAGCQFPHRSKDRRETRPRRHQGSVLVGVTQRSRQTAFFSGTLKHCASYALTEKRLTRGVARGRSGCETAKRPIWISVRSLRAGHGRVRSMRQGNKKRFKTPLIHLLRDKK